MSENGESSPSEVSPKKLTLAPKEPSAPPPAEETETQAEEVATPILPVSETVSEDPKAESSNDAAAEKTPVKQALRPSAVRPGVKPLARPGIVPKAGAAVVRPGVAAPVTLPTSSTTAPRPQLEDDLDDLDEQAPSGPLASPAWIIIDIIAASVAIAAIVMLYMEMGT
jgi:hypothetical protein